jgi:uncharacterized SAM-binding protein YcdF (DUF218 family)
VLGTFAAALMANAVFVFPRQVLPPVARWLHVGGRPKPADYVMVMPGGEETRPFVAAAMVRRGMAQAVLVPRTVDSPMTEDGILPPNHELIRRILNLRGVDDRRVLFLDQRSASSWGDAQALAEFLAERPGATVAVVTSDYHCRRSRWVFGRALGDRIEQVFFVSAPSDRFTPDDWWLYKTGFKTYVSEYCKFAVYLGRYGGLSVWVPTVVILLVLVVVKVKLKSPAASRRARSEPEGPYDVDHDDNETSSICGHRAQSNVHHTRCR